MIKLYEMNNQDIETFIATHISVKKHEKDKFGEVFTSPILINTILDHFPNTVWSNPSLTWLDPSVGVGFFMIFIYLRLMKGLDSWQTNKAKRSNHIISNMLFMVELNKNNCKICRKLFGVNANIHCGDFLQYNPSQTFDCIIGNPPFQDDYGLTSKGKRINGGKNKLYERIFLKSIDLLNSKGFISFIVPDNIFAGNGSKSYQTILHHYVSFVSFNPSNNLFFKQIQQPICYFILIKDSSSSSKLTTIQHDDKLTFQLKLQDRPVNPIRNWTPSTEKLISKYVSSTRNNAVYNRGKNVQSYKGTKYSVVFTPSKTLKTNNILLAPGLGIKKAIIFAISPKLLFEMDYIGRVGVGPNTFYIPFHSSAEGKKLEQFLRSDEYKTLALATKTNRQFIKLAFIEHLHLPTIFNKTKNKKITTNKTRKK
jgi:hypothetical protein